MGGVSASAAAAAVSTAGAKTKRGRSIVHKAAHAHASLRREEEGILSANEGLLQLSAKEASGDSRLGGIRESSHAFIPANPRMSPRPDTVSVHNQPCRQMSFAEHSQNSTDIHTL